MGIEDREHLAEALGVNIPESWPPNLYGPRAMQFALTQLNDAPEQGWSFWYLATREEPCELAGICGFKGRPDESGSVEIGYSILDCYQRRGFATEAECDELKNNRRMLRVRLDELGEKLRDIEVKRDTERRDLREQIRQAEALVATQEALRPPPLPVRGRLGSCQRRHRRLLGQLGERPGSTV